MDCCHNSNQSSGVNLLSPVKLISTVNLNHKSGIRNVGGVCFLVIATGAKWDRILRYDHFCGIFGGLNGQFESSLPLNINGNDGQNIFEVHI